MEYLEKEDILVKEIIENNNLHYVSVDIKNEVSLNGFLDDFILKRGKKI